MYKICYNSKVIKLAHSSMASHFPTTDKTHLTVHYPGTVKYITNYLDNLEKNKHLQHLYILHEDVEQLKEDFFSQFRIIRAAGGLVINKEGRCLFIYRRGHWDLPKGKIDPGEGKRQAAIREVMEETGLKDFRLIRRIEKTYHIYKVANAKKRVLKPTYWYLMSTKQQDVVPQVEEGIDRVEWKVTTAESILELQPIYSNIKDVLLKYLRWIK